MNQHPIEDRANELKTLANEKDISRATRRIMDLFVDFALPEPLKKASMDLRASYNILETNPNPSEVERIKLEAETLELLSQLENELRNRKSEPLPFQTLPEVPDYSQFLAFKARGISKRYRGANFGFQLPELSLDLKLGELTGVVGENGNGKTTLLRLVAGDLSIDAGSIAYPCFQLSDPNDWYEIKRHIAYIPQMIKSWSGSVKSNLQFAASTHGIYGKENRELVEFIIHRLGLSRYESATWGEISTGYKLRFELARALVKRPKLMVLDEPLANLDINTRALFLQDLQYLANSTKYPVAILLSSQQLQEVEAISDNIVFLRNGVAMYNGKVSEMGKDRSENIFEVGCKEHRVKLYEALKGIEGLHIQDQGGTLFIHTPTEIIGTEILKKLLENGVEIQYFREISQSTRKLFLE